MPDVLGDDELNALAAEYVLGTLDYEERKGAAALLEVDPAFRGIVRIWERRFGDLHLMVEAVEPDARLWQRIKPKMDGVEQIAPAIPSHTDEPQAAAVAAAPAGDAAATVPAAEAPPAEPQAEAPVAVDAPPVAEMSTGDAQPGEPQPTEPEPAEPTLAEPASAETPPAETTPAETTPAETTPAETKPAEVTPPAVAEAELKLAELAALLPVTAEPAGAAQTEAPAAAEPALEEGLHTHAPDLVPRGFVPPVPMSTRGTPAVVEVPVVRQGGRFWMAATLMMALVAVALAGLISAWRFFPERLPAQLRAKAVLNVTTQAALPAPKEDVRPQLPPFDE